MVHGGGPESTKFINLIPPTAVAWLLQYSGSRVEHRNGFSFSKMTCSEVKIDDFGLDSGFFGKNSGVFMFGN